MAKAVHVIIEGRVQGVWFRGWTIQEASALGLTGWVRNRRDGTVEAVFSGADADVDEMLVRCRRGPPMALVGEVTVSPADDPGVADFGHWPTA